MGGRRGEGGLNDLDIYFSGVCPTTGVLEVCELEIFVSPLKGKTLAFFFSETPAPTVGCLSKHCGKTLQVFRPCLHLLLKVMMKKTRLPKSMINLQTP